MAVEFDFLDRLGQGHFGVVWHVVDTGLNAERALKLIPPDRVLDPNNLFLEAQTLKLAEHPNVVRVEETGTMADGQIYIAMEYLPKGSLEDEASGRYVDLTRAQRIMVDALRGLQHAHDLGLVHRDIKPGNILVGPNSEGKLSDFGLSIPVGTDLAAMGAKEYAYVIHLAPEIHEGEDFTVQSDIYAAGITMYRLINGDRYLPTIARDDLVDACKEGKFPNRSKYRAFVPRPVRVFVNRAMNVDPQKRFDSADEMRHALEQVALRLNWREHTVPKGTMWNAATSDICYEVICLIGNSKKWEIQTRRGLTKNSMRRVTKYCFNGLSKAQADLHSRRILQDYVLGRAS